MADFENSTMYDVHDIMNSVTNREENNKFYCHMKNADGKEWLLDAGSGKSVRTGLNIYEPISSKGKLIKKMLPCLHRFFCGLHLFGFEQTAFSFNDEIVQTVAKVFETDADKLHFNFFLGTPSVHQKIVIQVDCGSNVLGYIKLSNNPEVIEAFKREYSFLNWLGTKNISNVPKGLYCSSLQEFPEITMFIQTSQKEKGSFNDSALNDQVLSFLQELHIKTECAVLFEDSEFYAVLCEITQNIIKYPADKEKLTKIVNEIIAQNSGQTMNYSAYHGDLTPWNSFYNPRQGAGSKFFAFDFEYAGKTFPAYLDAYHWLVSVGIFENHYGAEEIIAAFEDKKEELKNYDPSPEISLVLYLTAQISLYLKREKGQLSGRELENMKIWGALLEHFSDELL